MPLLDDAIAVRGGEAEHRRRTGRRAANPRGIRAETRADRLSRVLRTTLAALRAWYLTVSRRRAIADLSPDQLRDIGHPEAPKAVLEVKAGLITYLMSMR